ncbi:uncharacterized protein SPPG_06183 [Spizellomyces punctatus DAOM BR117]|uniref:Transmembrane protein 186 n=1 Tax=Spizellomyces punctatus (strain DAOM BR117) TaxID=645134 RepID=A0A0L0HCJ5_SPIPD|nr:uncharacterized protein SPPG_06183 [Spizellomyces punctatus DAOM BR117]KNC98483.1 hypothetical protein SPPG_06183 [Spizellomyces punctatus DAOM BR117]|eukprot:XP_016606523.1 hypothetical protein SPPG_06183 [Spizellomyces punctatus DAOM BR117]
MNRAWKALIPPPYVNVVLRRSLVSQSSLTPVYHGPLKKTLVLLKRVSATTFGLSAVASPLLAFAEYANLAVVGTMMGAALVTSGLSTVLVQYCVNPYVSRLLIPDSSTSFSSRTIILETLTFFGNTRQTAVDLSDIMPASDRPFATWKVRNDAQTSDDGDARLLELIGGRRKFGLKRRRFYVHPELDEGFSEQMTQVMRTVNAAGRAGPQQPQPQSKAGGKAWDDIVKDLRKENRA